MNRHQKCEERGQEAMNTSTELVERRQSRAVNPVFCSREEDFVRTKWV